ncbi:MAG: hypothetical protein ACE5LC_03570 [Candidatus Aminicenantales bacterium]
MSRKKGKYTRPRIFTYSSDNILEELGPAQACSPYWGSSKPEDYNGYAPGLPPFYEPPAEKEKKKDRLF